jgi:prepilin-type N-terminal cleavage/methylation domain-containing protein
MRNRAFTLIELLVVISIIGLLSSVVLTSLNSARTKAQDARRLSDLRQIAIAFGQAYGGVYPNTGNVPVCLGTNGTCWVHSTVSYTGNATINAALATYLAIPTDPTRTSGKGDRYLYIGPDSQVAPLCDGALTPIRTALLWVPDDTDTRTNAECKGAHTYACCGSAGCAAGYFCAYDLN